MPEKCILKNGQNDEFDLMYIYVNKKCKKKSDFGFLYTFIFYVFSVSIFLDIIIKRVKAILDYIIY